MGQQHRPLTGMTLTGSVATPPVVIPNSAYVIHQVDASNPTNFLDIVTLFLRNTDAVVPATVDVIVCGGTAMTVTVPVSSGTTVFLEQPFFGVPGQAAQSQITLNNTTANPGDGDVFAYGYFTR